MAEFDLIIVGTGVAGRTAVEDAVRAGLRTAIVDRREFGGTCALRGCEPKKVLFAAAEAAERVSAQSGHGVRGSATVSWPELIAFKRSFTAPLPEVLERAIRDTGAVPLHGTARFTSARSLDIDGTACMPRLVLLATGAKPRPLRIPGENLVIDTERFMDSDELPERVVFIGGGYVSFEFAHMAAAVGCQVTILHRGRRVLEGFDPDLADMLAGGYRDRRVEVRTDAAVSEVAEVPGGFEVRLEDGSRVAAEMVVHGAGRVPDLEGLDLAAGDVAFGPGGVVVDTSLRSATNPRVFAAGDAAAGWPPLTPVGIAQARVAVRNMTDPGSASFEPAVVPSVVFSDPPLASVGLTEDEAARRGLDFVVKFTDTSRWTSTARVGLTFSGAKTLVERDSDLILGAHLLGHGADEAINVVAAAMVAGLTARHVRLGVWAYPTAGSELAYLF